jgi:hypothetical protein
MHVFLTKTRNIAAAAAIALAAGCSEDAEDAAEHPVPDAPDPVPTVPIPVATAAEREALLAPLTLRADSVDRKLRRVRALSRGERGRLRRDVNAKQITRARQLGIRRGADVQTMVNSGRLVRLADSTAYWVVRDLDYSVPYVTPGTEAMLAEIGRRFHERLDSLHVPRFRLDITSVLRTPAKQKALRRGNRNASSIESAHEFGTTVDIAYRRFAAAAPDKSERNTSSVVQALSDSVLVATANRRAAELQAALGRVLLQMHREGKLMVMMERQQTVYHMTVARRFPNHKRVPAIQREGS